jgi:hypothetical protein
MKKWLKEQFEKLFFYSYILCYGEIPCPEDTKTFEEKSEEQRLRLKEVVGVDFEPKTFEDIWAICGVQGLKDVKTNQFLYSLTGREVSMDDSNPDIKHVSFGIEQEPIICNSLYIKNCILDDTIIPKIKETITPQTVEIPDSLPENLHFEIRKASHDIATKTRRGSGNTLILSEGGSIFDDCLYFGILDMFVLVRSKSVSENEAIICYKGVSDTDAGLFFVPTNLSEEPNFVQFGLSEIKPEYFRILQVNV